MQCRPHQDDSTELPAPDALLPQIGGVFAVAPEALRGTSYIRCDDGLLLACIVGANLNCGHADVTRSSKGGDAFCRNNPGASVIPLAATGHSTIYDWHCDGAHAVAGQMIGSVDRLGFIARNWRPIR